MWLGTRASAAPSSDQRRLHLRDITEWPEHPLGLLMGTVPARDQHAEQIPDPVLGDERQRRRDLPAEEASELLGRLVDEGAVALQDRRGIVEVVEQRAAHDVTDLVEPELEAGDDAEVAAAAAQRPEQVGVLGLAGGDGPPVGEDDVGREQVVAGEPVLPAQPADAAAEREAGDAGVGDDPARGRQPVELRLAVELAPQDAGLGADRARRRIDADPLHRREVDDQPAVADGRAGDVVAAAADGDFELLRSRELYGIHDIREPSALSD